LEGQLKPSGTSNTEEWGWSRGKGKRKGGNSKGQEKIMPKEWKSSVGYCKAVVVGR